MKNNQVPRVRGFAQGLPGMARRMCVGLLACMLLWVSMTGSAWAADPIVKARGHVYLRKGAGTNYDIVLVLPPNAELKVQGTSGEWYQVKYGNKTGYVRQDVVITEGAAETGTPTVTNTTGSYRTLKRGMTGDDVFLLQEALIYAGFSDIMPDSKYGELTELSVKNFQTANKLKADGIAGDKTQRLLLGDPANVLTPEGNVVLAEESGQPPAAPIIEVPADNGTLRLGSKGDAVRTLQTRLQELGYLTVRPDGSFGANTETAVKAFQQSNKLKADGVVGNATQTKLYASDVKAAATQTTETASGLLKEGSTGDGVKQMQTALQKLGFYKGTVTGSFGPLTREAVVAFQRANKLSTDGIAGVTTLNKLYGGSAVADSNTNSNSTANNGNVSAAGNGPLAANVINANWYSSIRNKYKAGTVVTIYDFKTGLSWRCRFMSNGKHADSEPMTSADTETMYRAFGRKTTWTPKAVWVTMPDGKTYIASLHNTPHLSGSIKDNNFDGHLCIHFPRDMKEAQETGPYAVSHQNEIIKGWAETQKLAGK